MAIEKKEGFQGNSDLLKAVTLLEENGFYVVFADSGFLKHSGEDTIPGTISIKAYPKRTIRVEYRPDTSPV